jgi:Mn2+/Fe2+ NRAMP family transporter
MVSTKKLIKSLLPGIFLFGFTVGTGSVTAMAKAGADYGMALMWTVFISCLITFFLINLFGKFTIVTGETALQSIRRHIHPGVAIFLMVALTANVCGSVIGVMGIVAQVCEEWSINLVDGGIDGLYFALFFVIFIYLLFLKGKTDTFLNVLAVMVAIMALCFLVNFFIFMPPVMDIVRGMVPKIPESDDGNSFLVVASMVGTTIFSGLFILRTTLVKEANWTMKDLKVQKRDALFSGFLMFLVSVAIMASAAGTLYADGIRLERIPQMISILEPLAGKVSVTIFTIGLVAAGVSSQFPNVVLLPWLLNDYHGRSRNLRRTDYRIYALLISLLGLTVPILDFKPITIMVLSQAFGALLLPLTVGCILFLGNKKPLMGQHKFGALINIILILVLLFSIYMGFTSYNGITDTLKSI